MFLKRIFEYFAGALNFKNLNSAPKHSQLQAILPLKSPYSFDSGVSKKTQARFEAFCWVCSNILNMSSIKGHQLLYSEDVKKHLLPYRLSPDDKNYLSERVVRWALHKMKQTTSKKTYPDKKIST